MVENSAYSLNNDKSLEDRQRFPTTVSLAAVNIAVYAEVLLQLLWKFSWNRIAVITDQLSGRINAKHRSKEMRRAPLESLRSNAASHNYLEIFADSTLPNRSFAAALIEAKSFSRGNVDKAVNILFPKITRSLFSLEIKSRKKEIL